jgi:hypothetical protein
MFGGNKCKRCEGKLKDAFSFCPYCGLDLRTHDDSRDFGMLGKNDEMFGAPLMGGGGLGISDKMIGSIFNSLMKNIERQMKNPDIDNSNKETEGIHHEVQRFPNGIKIKIGRGHKPYEERGRASRKVITQDQVNRMSKLPRGEAKADVRRFSDRVVYELRAHGVDNVEDIFVSRLEEGYEVKAIGKSKVYVNSLPVNLPLKKYFLKDKKLHVEFGLQ